MKFVKGFILAIIGLFIVVTLFSLLMPSRVMTVRTVIIHATPEKVFTEIADLQHWKNWHPVFMQDSAAMQISVPSTGVNALAEWGEETKKKKLRLTEIKGTQLKATLDQKGENEAINMIAVTSLKDSNNVQVEWRVLNQMKWYPWEKFSGIFVDKMTGPGYEQALANLKEFIEGKQ